MVGGLQYFTLTRPEISFAVGLVDKFMQSPRVPHLVVAKRILSNKSWTLLETLPLLPTPILLVKLGNPYLLKLK